MSRTVDPNRFRGRGGVIDWTKAAQTHLGHAEPPDVIADRRGTSPRSVHLRWAFDAALGYPTGPFTVWAKPPDKEFPAVGTTDLGFGVILHEPCFEVRMTLTTPSGGTVMAFAGMPLATGPLDWSMVPAGQSTVRLVGPSIRFVAVPAGSTVDAISGARTGIQDDPAWREVEVVGLPGDGRGSSFTDLRADQGLVTALTDPITAALQRFSRGAPFYGWDELLPGSVPVPPWVLADPVAMIKVFDAEMLGDFVDMCDTTAQPSGQHLREYRRTLPADARHAAEASFNPLRMVLYGGVSDPLAALVLGLGTAYPLGRGGLAGDRQFLAAVAAGAAVAVPDFMVTAVFRDDLGNTVERAALILGPGPSLPPPVPAALSAVVQGVQAPVALDDPFRSVITVAWGAPSQLLPFDIGSHAFARRSVTPAGATELVMDPRPLDVAVQPLGATRNEATPDRRALADATALIDSSASPNTFSYAVASQNLFGQWSPWATASVSVAEPPVPVVSVTAARLDAPAAPGACPATITCDLTWNWTSRSPLVLTLVGREYPQVWAEDPPPDSTVPTGDTFGASGAGILVQVSFQADGSILAVAPGAGLTATAMHLSVDGHQVTAVPLADRSTRRYRVQVSGFGLDFDTSGRWGVALWAFGRERRAPQRTGTPGAATVVSAADPRPPVITSVYDDVALASMRDTEGLHHAQLTWSPMPGAVGYHVYTCSEATFRAFHHRPEPRPSDTLRQRLLELQQAFGADPERRPFTRVGTEPTAGTSRQVTLPRGTREIHMFVVIGVSAGTVESAWPTTADPLCGKRFLALAAPATVAPAAPALEVSRGGDGASPAGYHARLRISALPGAEVARIDLHRVRVPEAAAQVETMGPPILTLTGSVPGYMVTPIVAPGTDLASEGVAQPLGRIEGVDAVTGSWRPVYYRAVAWGRDDPSRGQYGVRSAPSTPRSVVVPPSEPPVLDSPTVVLPTPGSADARIDFGTSAPVPDTVLGAHLLAGEVLLVDAAGAVSRVPLAAASGPLSSVPTAPPAVGQSGLWRDATAAGHTPLHLLVRRTDPGATAQVRLRITDPLGRLTEKVVDVPPGAAEAPPDIVNPVVQVIPGGWVLAFVTSAPDSTPAGPLRLEVSLRSGRGRPRTFAADVADLPRPPRRLANLLRDVTDEFPAYATRRSDGTRTIGIGLRAPGVATVSLVSGSARTTITRAIRPGRVPPP
ncbi:MAG TPA: hypothetical protein VF143_11200 [Candidatus Nanopelagicales bacterium]